MNTLLTLKHLRTMVDAAYQVVEKMREEKARIEGVVYVPMEKPIDLYEPEHALNALDKLNDERIAMDAWNRATEHPVDIAHLDKLVTMMKKFNVHLYVDPVNEVVNIQSVQEPNRG